MNPHRKPALPDSSMDDRTTKKVRKGSIYQLRYFGSSEEAAYWLELFADEKHPLILPDVQALQEVTRRLSDFTESRSLTMREVLIAFQYLRENHRNTNVFCGWNTNSGKRCGGTAYQERTSDGAYYQCTLDPNHRTPVQREVSGTRNITAERFWEMLCP
jgi:hypothetical protein